jgi:hypothetical protein
VLGREDPLYALEPLEDPLEPLERLVVDRGEALELRLLAAELRSSPEAAELRSPLDPARDEAAERSPAPP